MPRRGCQLQIPPLVFCPALLYVCRQPAFHRLSWDLGFCLPGHMFRLWLARQPHQFLQRDLCWKKKSEITRNSLASQILLPSLCLVPPPTSIPAISFLPFRVAEGNCQSQARSLPFRVSFLKTQRSTLTRWEPVRAAGRWLSFQRMEALPWIESQVLAAAAVPHQGGGAHQAGKFYLGQSAGSAGPRRCEEGCSQIWAPFPVKQWVTCWTLSWALSLETSANQPILSA